VKSNRRRFAFHLMDSASKGVVLLATLSILAVPGFHPRAAESSGELPATEGFGGPLTPTQVVDLHRVSSVALSADGERIVYLRNVPRGDDEEFGRTHQEIWMVTAAGGEPRPLTHAPGRPSAPHLSPDGGTVAFLDKRGTDEETQIYLIPVAGGEARRLTAAATSVSSLSWAPDGKSLAFVATDPESAQRKEDKEQGRDWNVVGSNLRPRRLWRVQVGSGEMAEITIGDNSVWHYAWFPDSSRLALTVSDRPDVDSSYIFKRLALVKAAGGPPETLWDGPGKMGAPAVSPDGEHVAINAAVSANDPAAGSLFVVPVADGEAVNLTGDLQATLTWVGWSADREVVFAAHQGVGSLLATISLDEGAELKSLFTGVPAFTSASVSSSGERFAMAASTSSHPDEVFTLVSGGQGPQRLTDSNPGLVEAALGEQKAIHWSTEDGLVVEGILILPVGHGEPGGPKAPYPLVSVVHGGPESCWHDGWNTSYSRWGQVLAGRGYAVLMANYRGSTGRGVAYAKADHRDLAGREFHDILDGIDHLAAQGLIDLQRVGSGGGSYGGYFSAWAATRHSQRFRASVVFAGITNWMSFTGTSDIPEENSVVHWDLSPYLRSDLAWDRSPLAHIRDAHTPTLIAHGEKDDRVPLGQGTELYTALRLKGTPVEFVTYPREPHGLRERAHQLDYMNRALDWYDGWLTATETD
jgi:dipeptidyl aminopeptidase/acylaminoacyl peptidase